MGDHRGSYAPTLIGSPCTARPFEKSERKGKSIMLTLPALGQRIQREVKEAEAAANDAIAKFAALTASCAQARSFTEIGATTGHVTMRRLAEASQLVTQAAGQIARVHGELRSLNDDRIVMVPDFNGDCPPATAALAIVETA